MALVVFSNVRLARLIGSYLSARALCICEFQSTNAVTESGLRLCVSMTSFGAVINGLIGFKTLELPRFGGQLKTVGISAEVGDSQWS